MLVKEAESLVAKLQLAVEDKSFAPGFLEGCSYPAFIKSLNGEFLLCNKAFSSLCGGRVVVGTYSEGFLNPKAVSISETLDRLLAGDCHMVSAQFPACIGSHWVMLDCVKMRCELPEHPKFFAIGLLEVLRRIPAEPIRIGRSLEASWELFERLGEVEKECFRLLGRGLTVAEIATELGASRKSIEGRRARILEIFSLENNVQLGHLACRLQDAGLEDFGLQ